MVNCGEARDSPLKSSDVRPFHVNAERSTAGQKGATFEDQSSTLISWMAEELYVNHLKSSNKYFLSLVSAVISRYSCRAEWVIVELVEKLKLPGGGGSAIGGHSQQPNTKREENKRRRSFGGARSPMDSASLQRERDPCDTT